MHHLVALQLQANQRLPRQGPDEQAVLPGRKALGAVEGHAGDRRGLLPHMMRRLGAGHRRALGLGNRQEAVVDAVGRLRPAVVAPRPGDIDLIAAARTMFMQPEPATPGIERQPLRVAMAIGPDLRAYALAADEGVVRRHATTRLQTHQLALQLVQLLRGSPLVVLAQAHVQLAISTEGHARAEVDTLGELGQLAEDHPKPLQRAQVLLQPATADCGAGPLPLVVRLGVAQVDQAIGGEARRQRDIQQPALTTGEYRRHAAQRRMQAPLRIQQAQAPGALADQVALPLRQEGQGPGVLESADHLGQLQFAQLAALGHGRRGQRQQARYGQHQQCSFHRRSPDPSLTL